MNTNEFEAFWFLHNFDFDLVNSLHIQNIKLNQNSWKNKPWNRIKRATTTINYIKLITQTQRKII